MTGPLGSAAGRRDAARPVGRVRGQARRGGRLLTGPVRRVGPGRLDAVVAHGVATGVLVEAGDGAVRARYAD